MATVEFARLHGRGTARPGAGRVGERAGSPRHDGRSQGGGSAPLSSKAERPIVRPVIRTDRADEDLIAIWLETAADNAVAADRVLDAIEARWQQLAEHPLPAWPGTTSRPAFGTLSPVGISPSIASLTTASRSCAFCTVGGRSVAAASETDFPRKEKPRSRAWIVRPLESLHACLPSRPRAPEMV